jgi:hypothetical protein
MAQIQAAFYSCNMKARRNLIQIWLFCAAMLPAVAQAQFIFMTNNGAITIYGYTGSEGVVTIPSTTNGYPVTSIFSGAFGNCTNLTSIAVPNSVTNIGLYDPAGLPPGAFQGCTSLTNITIGNSVTYIGEFTFAGCTSLTSITIPNSVTFIDVYAFYDCTSLTNLMIGSGVTRFGDNVIPGNGFQTFSGCTSLSAITVDPNNSTFSSMAGVLFNKSQTMLILYPEGNARKYYAIPNNVTTVGHYALYGSTGLANITIPNSVTSIGQWAFGFCSDLTSIYFTGNAPSLGGTAFYGDTATVYYLPWTAGWSTSFGGLTAVPWLPQAQTSDASFGVQTNQFGFNINWASGQTVVVEASVDLIIWQPVGTNTITGGSSYFSDPQWTNYPGRFYRLRSP